MVWAATAIAGVGLVSDFFGSKERGKANDAAMRQAQAAQLGNAQITGPGGVFGFSGADGVQQANVGDLERARQLSVAGANSAGGMANAFLGQGRGRNVSAEALQLLRAQARPGEEQALQQFTQGLYGSGRGAVTGAQGNEASMGGGRLAAAFAQGLSRADLDRQFAAQSFASGQLGLDTAAATQPAAIASAFQNYQNTALNQATGLGTYGLNFAQQALNQNSARSNAASGVASNITAITQNPNFSANPVLDTFSGLANQAQGAAVSGLQNRFPGAPIINGPRASRGGGPISPEQALDLSLQPVR